MAAQSTQNSVLIRRYLRAVPYLDAVTRRDLFVGFSGVTGGLMLGLVGWIAYLWTEFGGAERYTLWTLRELAFGSVGLGVSLVLAGTLVSLVGLRNVGRLAGLGLLLCLFGIGVFAYGYPTAWNVTTPPDYSPLGATAYGLGICLLMLRTGGVVSWQPSD
jgi:hypothetical protein